MTQTRLAHLPLRIRHLAAVIAVSVVAAGCLPGAVARSGGDPTSTAAAVVVTPRTTGTAAASVVARTPKPPKASASPRTTSAPTEAPTQAPPSTGPVTAPSQAPDIQGTPTLAQLVGQRLVVRMDGTTASASLLGRIRRGEVGGVILFGANIVDATQLRALTGHLHAAAVAGGQPRLLVMTDQEGGAIRRIPWVGPTKSARQMAATLTKTGIRTQGQKAGLSMDGLGIDVDLAPVGDVPRTTSSFMWLDGRTFGFDPSTVSPDTNAFALGLRDGRTVATMKHFPGIGRATKNTDNYQVTLPASLASLQARDLVPYTTAIANGIPMIMLSNANYPSLDAANGAGWSRAITKTLLRDQMGFRGVTITDGLPAAASTRGVTTASLAIAAAVAGTDFLLVTSSETHSAAVYQKLLAAAQAGTIPLARLQASYKRITTLKAAQ